MIKWSAPEFTYHDKDVSWYWLVAVIAAIVTTVALWQNNFLFAVFAVIAAITLIAWGRRQPELVDFELSGDGCTVSGMLYPKERFDAFAIQSSGGQWDRLILRKKSKFRQRLVLPVPHDQIDSVKKQCLNLWEETELPASLVDELSDFFRF